MRKRKRIFLWLGIVLTVLCGAGYGYYRSQYPFGYSHHCETALHGALTQYAFDHEGRYPSGEATAEASLSLLHREGYLDAYTLGGKGMPPEQVRQRLEAGELLTPATCHWHYVAGLRSTDAEGLALFWDKAGLDHNGRRLRDGGHVVWYITGIREYVPAARWEAFLAEQRRLLAERQ